jgi:hypothetical protein
MWHGFQETNDPWVDVLTYDALIWWCVEVDTLCRWRCRIIRVQCLLSLNQQLYDPQLDSGLIIRSFADEDTESLKVFKGKTIWFVTCWCCVDDCGWWLCCRCTIPTELCKRYRMRKSRSNFEYFFRVRNRKKIVQKLRQNLSFRMVRFSSKNLVGIESFIFCTENPVRQNGTIFGTS